MKWPDDDKTTVRLREITAPIRRAIRFAFSVRQRNTRKDIPWDGLDVGPSLEGVVAPVEHSLSLAGLKRARAGHP